MSSPLVRVTIGALCLLIGCGGGSGAAPTIPIIIDDTEDQPEDQAEAPLDLSALPARCVADAAPWRPGQRAFSEATSTAKLDAIDAQGARISAVDYDGDGLTDLMIRRGSGEDVWGEGGVRQVWLLKNTGRGVFEDVTQASGIVARRDNDTTKGRPAEVFAWSDVNNDGYLDAFTGITNANPSALRASAEIMLGQGDGTFKFAEFIENDARAPQRIITTGGASFTDVDRDGVIDLWVTEGGPAQDKLYRGDGDGVLRDITEAAGLITQPWQDLEVLNQARAHTNAWSAAACDLNNDGRPELLSASYGRAPNHLWRATGSGAEVRYENHAIASGYAFDPVQDWSDNESARCHCQLNRQAPGCEGVPAPRLIACQRPEDAFRWSHDTDREPFRLGGNSGTTVCADLNNDGHLDLVTTDIVHWDVGQSSDPSQLLYNAGDATFERAPLAQSGFVKERGGAVTWDDGDITVAAFDFDHDGRLDLYLGTTDYPGARGRLYHQRADGTFEEVAITEGIDHRSSHGIAVADFDGDGDLDLVAGHSRNRCASGDHCYPQAHARYFENTIGAQAGGWLQVRLEGAQGTNRAAIGARLSVVSGDLTQTREVGGGHGHYGMQDDLVQHVGLGSACEAEVTITWPDQARSQETYTLKAGYRYHITQGAPPRLIDPAP